MQILQEEGRCWLNFGVHGMKHGEHGEGLGGDVNATFEGLKSYIWIGLLRIANKKELSWIGWDSWMISQWNEKKSRLSFEISSRFM